MGLNRSDKPAMYRLFRNVVNNLLRSGALPKRYAAIFQLPRRRGRAAATDRKLQTGAAGEAIANMSFDPVSRQCKVCIKSASTSPPCVRRRHAAGVFHAVLMAAPISRYEHR